MSFIVYNFLLDKYIIYSNIFKIRKSRKILIKYKIVKEFFLNFC